jgi:hypothetical protein
MYRSSFILMQVCYVDVKLSLSYEGKMQEECVNNNVPKKEQTTGRLRKLHNAMLHGLYPSLNIIRLVK